MKLRYKNLIKQSRLLKTVTGLNQKEFDILKNPFEQQWEQYMSRYTFEGKKRNRKRKVRTNSTFKCTEDMMIFILYHYRHNPTQDLMGLEYDLPQPKISKWIQQLEPLLEKTLKALNLHPARSSSDLDGRLVESVAVLLDGSERPIQRPKYDQQEFYSGKKRTIQ